MRCSVSEQTGRSLPLPPASTTSAATVTANLGVLGGVLMPIAAMSASGVLVPEPVDSPRPPSPVMHVGGTFSSTFSSGRFHPRRFSGRLSLACSAGSTRLGAVGVFRRVLMSIPAVRPTGGVGSMLSLVRGVILRRVPAQILQAIVGANAVAVTRLHTRRAGADEGFENQAMNGSVDTADSHLQVLLAFSAGASRGEQLPLETAYPTKVADLIARKVWDWPPHFWHGVNRTVTCNSIGDCYHD